MIRTVTLRVFLALKSAHGADSWRSKIRACRRHSGVELLSCLEVGVALAPQLLGNLSFGMDLWQYRRRREAVASAIAAFEVCKKMHNSRQQKR